MQTQARHQNHMDFLDDSDDEARDLFDKLNPHSDSISHPLSNHSEKEQDEQARPLGRLSKMKKESKKDRKKEKKREKKLQKLKKVMEGMLEKTTPQKKSKKGKKMRLGQNSDSEMAINHDAGSSQYSSGSENEEDVRDQLQNLNPDFIEDQDPTPKKRLKRSSRKERIEQKEGFRIDQLGNEARVDLDEIQKKYVDEDYSFDDIDNKKKKQRTAKAKAKVPTNEEIMAKMKNQGGVVESQGQEKIANYDNGLDMLYSMKDKRKGGIKINNRLFCDIQIDMRDEEVKMPPTQTLQLELKPRTSTQSSSRFTFLDKVETLKKQRGLQANVDMQDYERKLQEKAKQSMVKAVSSMIQQDFHDDIELQVRVPAIARGKSADIINNTVFLKSFVRHKSEIPESPMKPSVVQTYSIKNKNESLSRQQFYRQIQQQSRNRKSKIISEEELINSFKKTNLGELEEARKRIQQKRRKEMLSEDEEEQQGNEERDMDSEENKIEEMIEKEQILCGDIEAPELDDNENKVEEKIQNPAEPEKKLEDVEFKVNLECEEQNEEEQEQEQEINEQNEVIDELASASQHIQEAPLEQEEENQNEQENEGSPSQPLEPQEQQMQVENQMIPEFNEQDRQKMIEMQEEGIMMRKRKIGDAQPKEISTQQNLKENIADLPNRVETTSKNQEFEDDEEEEFNNFRKLRKIAMVIAHKKKIREQGNKYASQFIENEAEEGSDNEEHDDMIKNIDYAAEQKEYEGMDLDADLVELIDNAVDLNEEDEQAAFRKYLEDIRLKDKEEIKKIIRGQFRTRNDDIQLDIDEDQRKRQERMEEVMNWMKKREEQEGAGIYLKEPQPEEENSDDENSQFSRKDRKKKKEEPESDGEKIPQEQEKAMIQKFIEDTLPSVKKDYKPVKMIDLGPLPQSVKMDKSTNSKTISMTKLGSKHSEQSKPTKLKKNSSLVNEILSRNSISKITQRTLSARLNKK